MVELGTREAIQAILALLREEIGCDLSAVGLTEPASNTLRWPVASGNANDRLSGISEKPGRGLSGTVMKVGRPMTISMAELVYTRQLQEYPLLLAENLRSVYAVPLYRGGAPAGVLVAGDRKKRVYRTEERRLIANAGERIASLLNGLPAARSV
ncbi:nitrogen regulatory protein A [Cohnella sp. OV330]|uniref:GAF domain-containing protein n=1 Tax=Cohnella sp. OV330 TaxID=1855288 RepID=UPI0008EB4C35|nr:GAF domain-containing protein [Cohnella sp. OV330]SFA97881.1 nitrogen regulatory protein A [Cohnella sp. OV330]